MESTVKKREWVKDAAIIFLAVLLVLTFFSNTIMNRSLPEVATAAVTNGSIIARVRGTGTVTATGKQQIKAKETRTIRSVMVKIGQEVNAGDVLFVLGEGDETLLEQAMDTLRSMQYAYQRMSLNVPTYDGTARDRAVDNAYEKLITAERARDSALDAYNRAVDNNGGGSMSVVNAEIERVLQELNAAEDELNQARYNYDARHQIALDYVSEAQYIYDDLYSSLYYERDMLSDEEIAQREAAIDSAWNDLEAAVAQLNAIESDSYMLSLETRYETLANRYESLISQRDTQVPETVVPYKVALDEAEEALYSAQAAYNDAVAARETAYQTFEREVAVSAVELAEQAENIRVQQEKVKALAGEDGNVVTATVSGRIDTIDCTAGDTVLKGALLCTIEVPDMGHTLSFSVTNDQARRLRIGDTASISNYYWGNSVTATLTGIRTDPKNPQSNKLLTFDLTGDVTAGAEMTISVGQKSANYDLIVPNSAIKSDANGSFVLVVTVKNSPLGNRYTARRVSVEVLASDDNNSAVVADLNNGDYVITTSSAPVASGDLVRMADNG